MKPDMMTTRSYYPDRLGLICGAVDSGDPTGSLQPGREYETPELEGAAHLALTLGALYGPVELGARGN